MEFSKPCSPNDKSNESINLWHKLPDEIVETILLNANGSSTNAIQDYHSIIQTCSRFQIVKKKGGKTSSTCLHRHAWRIWTFTLPKHDQGSVSENW